MSVTERSSKDVFLTSMYKMYYEQECISKKRKKLLCGVRIIDAASVVIPTLTLTIIGINSNCLSILLPIVGFVNILVAALRFFPFYNKSKELHIRSAKIETLINQMDLAWRMFQLRLTSIDLFTETHKALFEEYCRGFDSLNEVYNWKDKDMKEITLRAKSYMEEYLANPQQIDNLFERIADQEDNSDEV